MAFATWSWVRPLSILLLRSSLPVTRTNDKCPHASNTPDEQGRGVRRIAGEKETDMASKTDTTAPAAFQEIALGAMLGLPAVTARVGPTQCEHCGDASVLMAALVADADDWRISLLPLDEARRGGNDFVGAANQIEAMADAEGRPDPDCLRRFGEALIRAADQAEAEVGR